MNNRGFTLVELLATVVILSLVLGIGAYGIVGTINNSKNRNEKLFVDKLSDIIDEYIDLEGSSLNKMATEYTFDKCLNVSCSNTYEVKANELESINISNLINMGLLDQASVVNPTNKKKCFEGVDPLIRVFKDSDYVYYYYVDLSGSNTSCEISSNNGIINTLPDKLKEKVGL